ncbi:MAG TPA: cbb3-type cytochrome c oxidase subunit I [Verrucomicrobiae bacterium]|nr:cbb3-type cytochrome c oxidase subunit I [Verrucomicrobiae bacterium]
MIATDSLNIKLRPAERGVVLAHLYVAFTAFGLGTLFGLLQTVARSGAFTLPSFFDYYRVLTAHGVLLAIVFTTFFICGLSTLAVYQTIPNPQRKLGVAWTAWWIMLIGTAMAAVEILAGNASVLYTFYAPMKASPYFYLGATLLVVGTWVVFLDILLNVRVWKRERGGEPIPLPAFMALATFIMWFLATIGVAIEMLYLIPWAFGWTPSIDVLLTRMYFWYFGHPLVYFWILGAYVIWYAIVPAILKVPVFSDALTRVAFVAFIVLSLPVGLHHEFSDPGISSTWKLLQTFLTLLVVVPSLMTAFALFATFEENAAAKGRKGFVGIVRSIPWNDPAMAGITLAMILFIFGGFGGIVNASYSMDAMVHNTMWIVGHFHITVGGPVALTFLAATYRLLPSLTGRRVWSESLARAQVWLWFIGMSVMSLAMHVEGLLGAPRRTADLSYGGAAAAQSWEPWTLLAAGGGTVLFLSVLAFLTNVVMTLTKGERDAGESEFAFAPSRPGDAAPQLFQRLGFWTALAVVVVIFAYAGPLIGHYSAHPFEVPGMRTW